MKINISGQSRFINLVVPYHNMCYYPGMLCHMIPVVIKLPNHFFSQEVILGGPFLFQGSTSVAIAYVTKLDNPVRPSGAKACYIQRFYTIWLVVNSCIGPPHMCN